jgi:hypothetical protein
MLLQPLADELQDIRLILNDQDPGVLHGCARLSSWIKAWAVAARVAKRLRAGM